MNSAGPAAYILLMPRLVSSPLLPRVAAAGLALVAVTAAARAQESPQAASCAIPDSLEFVGATRRTAQVAREDAGLPVGQPASASALTKAVKNLFATGQYEDVRTACRLAGGKTIYT